MKKKILLILILILPIFINAKMNNDYNNSSNYANRYINQYSDNKLYILKSDDSLEIPYKYENNILSSVSQFKNGGLLNLDEFRKSKDKDGNTYLFTGNNYWTMTENSSKVYIISNSSADNELLTDKSSLSGTRVTEYVRENTGVTGSGTYNDPWIFVERYEVVVSSANTSYGDVSPKIYSANKGEDVEIRLIPNSEYEYDYNNCNAVYSSNKITIRNVTKNISCKVYFKKKKYTLTYNNNGGTGCTSKTVTSGNTWGTLCTPNKTNYEFQGWYRGSTKITASTVAKSNLTVTAKWQYSTLRLTYNNNGGSGCSSKTFAKGNKIGSLCSPSKSANQFDGWYTSATGGTKVTEDTIFDSATTIYAHWSPSCFEFRTSTGTITNYYDYKGNDSSNGRCSRSVTIPSTIGVTTVKKIGNSSFYEKNITSVTLPNTITEIGYNAFAYNSITSVTIPSSVIELKAGSFEKNRIRTLTLNEGLEKIDAFSFSENQIRTVKVPSTLKIVGDYAFNQNNISSLTLNNILTRIGSFAFFKNRIQSVTIPKSVTYLGNASFNDNQLPDSVATMYKRNSDGSEDKTTVVSYGGRKRYSVVVPSTVTNIDNYAYYENDISSMTIPSGVTRLGNLSLAFNNMGTINIPSTVTYIGESAMFANWASTINYTSSNLTFIGSAAFNANSTSETNAIKYKKNADGTDDLTTIVSYSAQRRNVTVPSTVTKIDEAAFFNTFLYSVAIPESVTYIGTQAFDWCFLSTVTIPSKVTFIGSLAFNKYYDTMWGNNINPMSKVINKAGKAFAWHYIINGDYYNDDTQSSDYYLKEYTFETGTVKNPRGNVTITK